MGTSRSLLQAIALAATFGACGFREVASEPACFEYVVASDSHTCARKTDGSLWCWGNNQHGQLGVGDTEARLTPVRVGEDVLGSDVAGIYSPTGTGDLSTRTAFTCARKNDGTLWCWGNNEYGQLGTNDRWNRLEPVQVHSLGSDVHAVSLGSGFGCARKNDNTLWCWGANESGQLGTGDTFDRLQPLQILGANVRRLATGGAHVCARKTDGTLWCWGNNQQGQLGMGDTMPRLLPAQVDEGGLSTNADVIVTGAAHSCVTRADMTLWCWGAHQYGQLGLGGEAAGRSSPQQVTLSDLAGGVPLVAAGANHTCAAKIDGTLWCWGSNRGGQLGTGDRENSAVPMQVQDPAFGAQIAVVYAGGDHTCARNLDSSLWCWGNNQYGQLGIGPGPSSATPALVEAACP